MFPNLEKPFSDLNSCFVHENDLYRISISKNGQLRQCKTKLDLLAYLYPVVQPTLEPLDAEVKLFDEAAFVNMNLPTHSKTYGKYCDRKLT